MRDMTEGSLLSAGERARKIQLIIFDVGGVLTDGGIWLFPAPAPSGTTADHAAQMESKGGHAAARDSVEFILSAKGILDKTTASYIDARNPVPASMAIGKGGF